MLREVRLMTAVDLSVMLTTDADGAAPTWRDGGFNC